MIRKKSQTTVLSGSFEILSIAYLEDFATPIWPDVQVTDDSLLGDNAAIYSMLTPPLEAGTIKWGFQRGRATPLVKHGVKSPSAKWLRLIAVSISLLIFLNALIDLFYFIQQYFSGEKILFTAARANVVVAHNPVLIDNDISPLSGEPWFVEYTVGF